MKEYVVGFMFTPDRSRVLLLRKARPAWQRGRLNGPGGLIQEGETPLHAMRREMIEETGILFDAWAAFAVLNISGPAGVERVHFFRAIAPDRETVWRARGRDDEPVEVHQIDVTTSARVVEGLEYLIPLALDERVVMAEIAEAPADGISVR